MTNSFILTYGRLLQIERILTIGIHRAKKKLSMAASLILSTILCVAIVGGWWPLFSVIRLMIYGGK
jgi:hypothetical protein